MKNKIIKKAISDIHDISMTSSEKKMMLSHILKYKQLIQSPWTVFSFKSWLKTHQLVSVIAIILIVAVSGNSIVSASQSSLPGDILYPIKVSVTEPIRMATIINPVQKAETRTELVRTRYEEMEILASRGELDEKKERIITDLIDRHVADISKNIESVKNSAPDDAEDVSITVQASIDAHAKILDDIKVKTYDSDQSERTSRLAEKAREDSKKFSRPKIMSDSASSTFESKLSTTSRYTDIDEDDFDKNEKHQLFVERVLPVTKKLTDDNQNDKESKDFNSFEKSNQKEVLSSQTKENDREAVIESKRLQREKEIYEKAKEKLDKESKKEEFRASRDFDKPSDDRFEDKDYDRNKDGPDKSRDSNEDYPKEIDTE